MEKTMRPGPTATKNPVFIEWGGYNNHGLFHF